MTIATGEFLTFSAIGNREDLTDMIYNISPTDTPFMGNIGKTKATAVLHEWQSDTLAAAAANAQLEGDDIASFTSVSPTSRLTNTCQISYKNVVVSGTQDAVNKAGRQREIVYQLTKRAKELRRDMEFVLTNNQAPVTGNSTTARALRPLPSWYSTCVSKASDGTNGSTSAARGDGTQRALTESMVKSVLQTAWTNGGDVDLIMTGPFNKTVVSSFTGNATRFVKAETEELVATIDVYRSDFGTHKIVANRFSRDREVHLLDTELWATAFLRPQQAIDLAKTGDSEKGMVLSEYTLEGRNEKGSGIIADLTTS
jgi:hypothetical protein